MDDQSTLLGACRRLLSDTGYDIVQSMNRNELRATLEAPNGLIDVAIDATGRLRVSIRAMSETGTRTLHLTSGEPLMAIDQIQTITTIQTEIDGTERLADVLAAVDRIETT